MSTKEIWIIIALLVVDSMRRIAIAVSEEKFSLRKLFPFPIKKTKKAEGSITASSPKQE